MYSAGNKIISSAFRRALAEHRCLDFEEAALVEVIANRLCQLVPQDHRLLQLRPSQVDVAVLQPQLFIRQRRRARFKWWHSRLIEEFQLCRLDLDFARLVFRILKPFPARRNFSSRTDDEL